MTARRDSASAIVVAAGAGRRAGFDKLLADLGGRPVVVHSIAAFASCPEIGEIVVVAGDDRQAAIRNALPPDLRDRVRFVPGGPERHLSVWNGLQAAAGDLLAVHDGARPLIRPAQIDRCLARARECGAAASARRVTETLKRADATGRVTESVARDNLWIMETPQVFARDVILEAYRRILRDGIAVTDEVSAVAAYGHPVSLVDNDSPNLKITWPGDLSLAQRLLE